MTSSTNEPAFLQPPCLQHMGWLEPEYSFPISHLLHPLLLHRPRLVNVKRKYSVSLPHSSNFNNILHKFR